MTAKIFSVFAAFIFTSVMAQASYLGSWTGDLAVTNSEAQTSVYAIQEDFSQVNDVFTYSQTADDNTWITVDFNVVNGELFDNGVAIGTISDTGFSFTNLDIGNGSLYDVSFSLNVDGTANFQDKIHNTAGDEWEMVDGVLTFLTAGPVDPPAVP